MINGIFFCLQNLCFIWFFRCSFIQNVVLHNTQKPVQGNVLFSLSPIFYVSPCVHDLNYVLSKLCRRQSPVTNIYHWMYYITLGRKMLLIWIQIFFHESDCLSMSWQNPYLPKFWSSPCGPRTPWGIALVPACSSLQPKGRPGCGQSAGAPRCGGMLFPTPTAVPQFTQKLFKQVLLKKMGKICGTFSANSNKGFGVIRPTLFPQFLVCYLYRHLNLCSRGHPHRHFLSGRCCVAIISFSFFLHVQEFFVLLGTKVVLCCLIKV